MFLLNISSDFLNLHYKGKCETKLWNFFFSDCFNGYSMIYANAGDFKDPLKQDLALEFYRNQNKDFSILTETHINHDQIHHIKNYWSGPSFLSSGDSLTKGLLVSVHPDLEGVIEADMVPKRRFVSFKVTPSNDRVLCVYAPLEHSNREQVLYGLHNYMENESERNENKIIFGDFNCTMDKMYRNGGNKTQRLYRCGSHYALSKLIVDNGCDDLLRRENPVPLSSPSTIGSLGQDPG